MHGFDVIRCSRNETAHTLHGRSWYERGSASRSCGTGCETGPGHRQRQLHGEPHAASTLGRRPRYSGGGYLLGAHGRGPAYPRQRATVGTLNMSGWRRFSVVLFITLGMFTGSGIAASMQAGGASKALPRTAAGKPNLQG